MFIYTVHPIPGRKAKVEGDPSTKYQVKRVNNTLAPSQKGRSEIIRTDLGYGEAVALIARFNGKEESSQVTRDEKAEQEKHK